MGQLKRYSFPKTISPDIEETFAMAGRVREPIKVSDPSYSEGFPVQRRGSYWVSSQAKLGSFFCLSSHAEGIGMLNLTLTATSVCIILKLPVSPYLLPFIK